MGRCFTKLLFQAILLVNMTSNLRFFAPTANLNTIKLIICYSTETSMGFWFDDGADTPCGAVLRGTCGVEFTVFQGVGLLTGSANQIRVPSPPLLSA